MAFGKNIANSANKVQERLSAQRVDEHGAPLDAPEESSSVASAPVSTPAASPSSNRPGAFARPNTRPSVNPAPSEAPVPAAQVQRPRPMAPSPAPSAPVSAPAPAAPVSTRPVAATPSQRPAAPLPKDPSPPAAAPAAPSVSDLFSGYRQVMEVSRRADGLPLRVERLIDEISDFHGHTRERTEQAKKMALEDVKGWEKKLFDHYQKVIRPARQQTAQTLEEARRKNPGKGVFVVVSKGQSTIQVVDPSKPEHQELAVLNGATMERVASSRTPFRSPREVFGRQETVVTLENTDDAFGASETSPTPGKPLKP